MERLQVQSTLQQNDPAKRHLYSPLSPDSGTRIRYCRWFDTSVYKSPLDCGTSDAQLFILTVYINSEERYVSCSTFKGRDSSVGTATRYGLDGPGIESRWRRDSPHQSRPALGPAQPPVQWVPTLSPGVKRPARGADHPHLSAEVMKG